MIDDNGVIQYTEKQLAVIRAVLKITTRDYDESIIAHTSGVFLHYTFVNQLRSKASNLKIAREQLQNITDHAKGLKIALSAVPIPGLYFKNGSSNALGCHRIFSSYNLEDSQEEMFMKSLDYMISIAETFSDDERKIRAINFLPSKEHSNQSIFSQSLWPNLFKIYHEFVGKIAYSPGGPLELFIQTVHEATDLPPVSSATLRFATARWKQDKVRSDAG